MKRTTYLATIAVAIAMLLSCNNKQEKNDDVEDVSTEQMELADYEDLTLASSLDSASYAAGVELGSQFKEYNMLDQLNVDAEYTDEFLNGVIEAMAASDDKEKAARLAGLQIGSQLLQMAKNKNQQLFNGDSTKTMSQDHFTAAFISAVKGTHTLIAQEDAQQVQERFTAQQREERYADSTDENVAFLRNNAHKDGVFTTSSGLQFKVIKDANGPKPTADSRVKVHYEGRLIDGTVFDSSYDRGEPIVLGLNQVIKGWTEGLQLMPVGSVYELYIPQELGYGANGAGSIPPFSTLIFKVELLGIE